MYSTYCTILMMHITQSKIYYSDKKDIYSLIQLVRDEWIYSRELLNRSRMRNRLRGGSSGWDSEDYDYVTPKDKTERYADCVVVTPQKMLQMRLVALVAVRKLYTDSRHFSKDEQIELMTRVTLAFFAPNKKIKCIDLSDQHLFFRGKTESGKITFVPDQRLLQMEFATRRILCEEMEYNEEQKETILHVHVEPRLRRIGDCIDILKQRLKNIDVIPSSSLQNISDASKSNETQI